MSTIVTRSGKGSPLTHAEVDSNFTNLNTDKLELSGGTLTGTLNFGDNVKAQFGASADLSIFHDGSNSYITDNGTGQLYIGAYENPSTDYAVKIGNVANNQIYAGFNNGSSVDLFFNNSKKLETSSTGVNINGIATLTSSVAPYIKLEETSVADTFLGIDSGHFWVRHGSLASNSFQVSSNNDISFYEDTGTNVRFFWDASEEALGIGTGTGTPLGVLHLKEDNSQFIFTRNGTETELKLIGGTNEDSAIYFGDAADNVRVGFRHDSSANALRFMGYNNAEAMRIDSNGRLGIGTSSPAQKLDVNGTAKATTFEVNGWTITESGGSLYFATGGTNKMKLDASGNLDVVGSVNANATIT